MEKFDDQLWVNIRNFVKNLILLPLWKDRSMASTIFAGKNNGFYGRSWNEFGGHPKGMLGKHHSEETKKRISETCRLKRENRRPQ